MPFLPRRKTKKSKTEVNTNKKTVERSFDILTEVISRDNVLDMAELLACNETKYLICFSDRYIAKAHFGVCEDLFHKDEPGYIMSDNYDMVQTVALFLCEYFGKHLEDTYEITKKGRIITIKYHCYKLIDRMICGRYRITMRHVDLDKAYHLEAQEVYKADEDEHEVVEQMMNTMQLDEYQRKVLTHRMAGLSMGEIGRILNRSTGAIGSVIYTIQRRYNKCFGGV